MSKLPVLLINSYGGSLTTAAVQEGHPVVASMEDHNYGLDSQRLNYPNLHYIPYLSDWPPDLGLRGTVVLAHPPCAGFSTQNRSPNAEKRGLASVAFACTKRLLDYVMPRDPEAIAIESVTQALKGGREVHDFYGRVYGYDAYRILQNAASFGVPQWRRRFWIIYVRQKPNRPHSFTLRLRDDIRRLGDVLPLEAEETELSPVHQKLWPRQVRLAARLGYTEDSLRELLRDTKMYGNLIHILAARHQVPKVRRWPPWGELHDAVVGGTYLSGALHVLDPQGFAPTLMGYAWWYYGNRQLGYSDLKEIMGFPRDYRYHNPRLTAQLLSKGVCPPVARWVLRMLQHNITGEPLREGEPWQYHAVIKPGEVADLQLSRGLKGAPQEDAW